jgi:hypothetical protein
MKKSGRVGSQYDLRRCARPGRKHSVQQRSYHPTCTTSPEMTSFAAVKRDPPLNNDSHARFVTTRWSIVLSCSDSASDEEKAQAALAELCKIYWRPVFAFICRQGHSIPDAQDLTQEFFGRVIKGRLIQSADRNKGRFRSLLLKTLQRFLHDQVDKRQARKHGGTVPLIDPRPGI